MLDAARANSICVADPTEVPGSPSEPRIELNLTLSVALGLVGGIGLAFVAEDLDTSVHYSEDLEESVHAQLPGTIPGIKVASKLRRAPLLLQQNGKSTAEEAVHILEVIF